VTVNTPISLDSFDFPIDPGLRRIDSAAQLASAMVMNILLVVLRAVWVIVWAIFLAVGYFMSFNHHDDLKFAAFVKICLPFLAIIAPLTLAILFVERKYRYRHGRL
jgi:hypothetical protein